MTSLVVTTADGQVASVTDNANDVTSYAYGHDGELLSTTDPLSHVSSDSYNNRLWLASTTDADNGTTQYGYDPAGNLTSLTDSVGNEDQYTYSSTNQVLTDTNQLGYARTYVYNASGDLAQETDRNGLVRDFTYDNDHRETAEKWMGGGSSIYTISYAYNADNAVTSASDPDSSYAYSYDNLGRVTSLDNSGTPNIPHVVLASQYDLMNDRTQLTATVAGTADFINAYSFDADQRMLQATQEGQTGGNGVAPKGIGYAYNLDSQMTSVLRFDPTTTSPHPDIAYGTLSYDTANRLTEIKYTHLGNTLDDLTWAYDAANRVTSFTSSVDGTATYSYDSINELTAATYTGTNQPANESYSFDANGNRTNTGYSTGTNNQLTSDGTFNYTYDHEGNRLTRTRISSGQANDYKTTYTWDYRNRLTDVNYYNNSNTLTKHIHYVYDVFNHLIGTELDPMGGGSYTSSEWYTIDLSINPNGAAQPVLQFDGSGNLTYRYLVGPSWTGFDAVLGEESITTQGSAGTTTFSLGDNLGSIRDIVNTSSTVVDHIVYTSGGLVTSESSTAIHHWASFAGYHPDVNTGALNAYRRWYDPAVIRWESEDPLGFGGGDTNVGRYVGNRGTAGTDPSGLEGPLPLPDPPQPDDPDATYSPYDYSGLMQFGLTAQQAKFAYAGGCGQLMLMIFNMCQPYQKPAGVMYSWPSVTTFSNYWNAFQYWQAQLAAGNQAYLFAYQFNGTLGPVPPNFVPPAVGALSPSQFPALTAATYLGNVNWATLHWSTSAQALYWQYMNHGSGTIADPTIVYHAPFNPSDPKGNFGLPGPARFGTTAFGVYVAPKPPPPPAVPPAQASEPGA